MSGMLPPPHSMHTSLASPTRSSRGPLSPTSPRAGMDRGGWPGSLSPGGGGSTGASTGGLRGKGFSSPPASPVRSISSAYNPEYSTYRSPKVFGDPGLGLLPSAEDEDDAQGAGSAANGATGGLGFSTSGVMDTSGGYRQQQQQQQQQQQKREPYLRVRLGALERNRKDLLVRFDASTNLPNFRTGMYRNIQRSYVEFQRFAEQTQLTSPQTIIPALPLASTSALTDEEDDRLVRIALQRWFTRVCEDPVIQRDDELRSFIESDFGYSPVPPPSARKQTSAASAATAVFSSALSKVVRRGPLDEDDELQSAKAALERLEERWGGAAAAINNLGKARRAQAFAYQDMGARFVSYSTVESEPNLAAAERKLGRYYEQLSGMAGAQSASDNMVLSDSLGYQALNARAAKDALIQRTHLLDEAQTASKSAITKRRNVERLKGSSKIDPVRVDDAIAEMEEANTLEKSLNGRLNAMSTNLHVALRAHSRQAHEDVALALLENARLSVGFHKHVLRELEAVRPEVARIGKSGSSAHINGKAPAQATYGNAPYPNAGGQGYGDGPLGMPQQHQQQQQQPSMVPSRPYNSPPPQSGPSSGPSRQQPYPQIPPQPQPGYQANNVSQSMFLPSQQANQQEYPHASGGPLGGGLRSEGRQAVPPAGVDPLGGHMAQSMYVPGPSGGTQNAQRAQQAGRPVRRLDERQAAKMLAGGGF